MFSHLIRVHMIAMQIPVVTVTKTLADPLRFLLTAYAARRLMLVKRAIKSPSQASTLAQLHFQLHVMDRHEGFLEIM